MVSMVSTTEPLRRSAVSPRMVSNRKSRLGVHTLLGIVMLAIGGCWGTVNTVVNVNTGDEGEVEGRTESDTADQNEISEQDLEAIANDEGQISIERHDSSDIESESPFDPELTDIDVGIRK